MLRDASPTKMMLVVLTLNWVMQNLQAYFAGEIIQERRTEIVVVFSHGGIVNEWGITLHCLIWSLSHNLLNSKLLVGLSIVYDLTTSFHIEYF
jgi:hypothetical protein